MRILSLFLLSIFFLFSCDKNTVNEDIISVPLEFEFNLSQVLTEYGPAPSFEIKSLEKMGCENEMLTAYYNRKSDALNFRIVGKDNLETCNGEKSHLTFSAHDLLNEGKFSINILLKDFIKSSGELFVSDKDFHFYLQEENGIRKGINHIEKIPANIVWGRIVSLGNGDLYKGYDIITQLKDISKEPTLVDGNYGIFKVSNQSIMITSLKSSNSYVDFVMKYENNLSEIKEIFRSFKNENPELKVHLSSSYGVIFE